MPILDIFPLPNRHFYSFIFLSEQSFLIVRPRINTDDKAH